MKFSEREEHLIQFLKSQAGKEFEYEQLLRYIRKAERPTTEHFRKSVTFTLRRLKDKLVVFGVDITRTSPLGRGNKAYFKVSKRISKVNP